MINEQSLQRKLSQYTKSSAGKTAIQQKVDDIQKGVSTSSRGSGSIVTLKQGEDMAKDLIQIIKKHLTLEASSIGLVGESLSFTAPRKSAKGFYEIVISFDRHALRRESILPKGDYPQAGGVDNIVALFNNGYKTKELKTVYGTWQSTRGNNYDVVSKPERDPLLFMQAAVNEFNGKYKAKYGIIVTLGGDYS